MCVAILVFFIHSNKGMKNKTNNGLSQGSTTGTLSLSQPHSPTLSTTLTNTHKHTPPHSQPHTATLSNHRLSLTHITTGGRNGTAQFFSTVGVDSAEGKA